VNKTTSFYWFDYETFGTHPAWDRPCQFAGIRTDAELNVIGEPLVIYCRQSPDYLPNPEACRVTGISPQLANDKGLCEAEFIRLIHEQMTFPGTCSVGYNNIRFDDEFTRHTLFRNLFDAYEQEWKNDCSRWDLLDIVRLTRALRPGGIHWPTHENGTSTNRLEHLSVANGIEHSQAHDAMSDVWATLGMAKLIKQMQPRLFDYAFNQRGKHAVADMLNTQQRTPCLQISGMIPADRQHTSPIIPLCRHPKNSNSVIVLDLYEDSQYLADLDSDEIAHRLFTPTSERSKDDPMRPGLRTIQINKCPVLVPLSTLGKADALRLGIDKDAAISRAKEASQWLVDSVIERIAVAMHREWPDDDLRDVDGTLYTGKFLSQADKQRLQLVRGEQPTANTIDTQGGHFDDKRLDEILRRYVSRNYPDALNADDSLVWREHCIERLNNTCAPWLSFPEYEALLDDTSAWNANQEDLRTLLRQYGDSLKTKLGISS
jgi:exodeoxyribonuclease-1